MCVQSEGSELTAITETRWDSSCGWNGVTKGHTLLRRDRPGALRGGFDLYMRQHLACDEFCLRVGDERGENLWVRTKELAGKSDTVPLLNSVNSVWVFAPGHPSRRSGDNFYRQPETASQTQSLAPVGEFPYPVIHWRGTDSPGCSWKALMINSHPQ